MRERLERIAVMPFTITCATPSSIAIKEPQRIRKPSRESIPCSPAKKSEFKYGNAANRSLEPSKSLQKGDQLFIFMSSFKHNWVFSNYVDILSGVVSHFGQVSGQNFLDVLLVLQRRYLIRMCQLGYIGWLSLLRY